MYGQGQPKYDFNDVVFRIQKNAAFTSDELAYILEKDKHARLDFMVLNNPAIVNDTLKYKLGDNSLSFKPDTKAIQAHVDLLLAKDMTNDIATVERYFKYNENATNGTGSKELAKELKKYFPNWF